MRIFRVKVDYVQGRWDPNHPNPIVEVLASDAKEAAESACGRSLRAHGRLGEYCAQVWPVGGVRRASEIAHFFSI
jgi:hypothetical protein